jgi:hypothetical protein
MPGGTAATETTSLSISRIEAQPVNKVKAIAAKTIENHRVSCRVAVRMTCPLEDYIEMT